MTALGLLILRVVLGLTLAAHGSQKVFGWFGGSGMAGWTGVVQKLRLRPALAWAWMAALSELVGGLLVALGFLFPLGSLMIFGAMLVAIVLVHWPNGFWNTKRGYEFNLLIIAAGAALALIGPGAYSLDQILRTHLPEPLTLIAGSIAVVAGVVVSLATRTPAAVAEAKPQTT